MTPTTLYLWQAQAACAGEDPGPWDHDTITGATRYAVAYATRICAECPVRVECLTDANAHHDEHGIRGGLLPSQRRVKPITHGTRGGARTHRKRGQDPCDAVPVFEWVAQGLSLMVDRQAVAS